MSIPCDAGKGLLTVSELLETGLVRRYHTVPTEGRGQTTAEHSWGVALLIATYHPAPSVALLKAAIMHDMAEKWTGDCPAQIKWAYPPLSKLYEVMENDTNDIYGFMQDILTPREKVWLHAADTLEAIHYTARHLVPGRQSEWNKVAKRLDDHMNQLVKRGEWPFFFKGHPGGPIED